MAATAQSARVGNLTLEKILPKVADTVNKSSWILNRVLTRPIPWNGRLLQEPLFINNSTLGQSFKGVETFSTSIDMNTVNLTWYSTGYAQPVTISTVERGINSTPLGVIDLYRVSFEYAQNSMSQALGTTFYGFGNGNDFDGLGVIIDDGTSTSTYAGLSRTTYGSNINAGGATGIIAASGGVIDLTTMDSADDAATVSGLNSETPNIIATTRAVWSLYGSLLEPTKMAMYQIMGQGTENPDGGFATPPGQGAKLQGGQTALTYRGKDLIRDDKCTSGVMFFVNETLLEFHSLNLPGLSSVKVANQVTEGVYDKVPPTAFQWRDLMSPVNQLAEVGIFVLYGNLIHKNPIRNEKITGITTT